MKLFQAIGNLGHAPESRVTQGGKTVCTFDLAVNATGGKSTEWIRVSAFDRTAENCMKYLDKGRKVYIAGNVKPNAWTGKDGQIHCQLQVTANVVEFLSASTAEAMETAASEATQAQAQAVDQQSGMPAVDPEDLPF